MPAQKNIEYLEKTKSLLKPGKAFYFTDFTGLSVKSLEELRRELKKHKGNYVVLKNSIGYLAMKDMGFDETAAKQLFTGPTGIAIAFDDPIVLAKILTNHENLKLKGSFIEGTYYPVEGIIKFSKIPSKDVLYRQLCGSLNVVGNFIWALEGMMSSLINTIEAMKQKEAK